MNAQMIMNVGESARLFDAATTDDAVIDALERLLDTMKQARRAKTRLVGLPPGELRAVLAFRAAHRGSR